MWGTPIEQVPLTGKNDLGLNISYSPAFREIEACVAAGLNYADWIAGEYSQEVMDHVVAWHDLKGLIDAHKSEAEARSYEKAGKKGR